MLLLKIGLSKYEFLVRNYCRPTKETVFSLLKGKVQI